MNSNEIINYGKQTVGQEEIDAVTEVLRSNYLTQGTQIPNFEKKFQNFVDSKYAIAVSNGTTALHLSYLSLGLKAEDIVLTTPITFSATANAALYCGANVKFIDISNKNYLIDLGKLEKSLKKYEGRVKIVTLVSLCGHPVGEDYWNKLNTLKKKYNFSIVEDACHSIGAWFKDSTDKTVMTGSCKFSDVSTFSFHPVKGMTCGEGGMITTNNNDIYKKCKLLRSHGLEKVAPLFPEVNILGYNYRLTEIQAAMASVQLKKLPSFINRRQEIAMTYLKDLDSEISKPIFLEKSQHGLHLFVIRHKKRDAIFKALKNKGINTMLHYKPLYHFNLYKDDSISLDDFSSSEEYYKTALSIPIFPLLKDKQISLIVDIINQTTRD